jgi:hypothetical protein
VSNYPPDDADDVRVLFPEVNDIIDEDLQWDVIDAVGDFPQYFWSAAGVDGYSTDYHPPEHQARHGLWLYTKRVCTVFESLAQSAQKQGHMTTDETDMGRAACIVHNAFKHGEPPSDGTVSDSDIRTARWVQTDTDLSDTVANMVEAHKGGWGHGRRPQTHTEQMVHIANMIASESGVAVAVKDPCATLEQAFPAVEER